MMKKLFYRVLIPVSTILLNAVSLYSQSTAAILDQYSNVLKKNITGIDQNAISGVAFNAATGTLFIIDDGGRAINEITTTGEGIRSITLSGFEDTEGIVHQSGQIFLIAEERRANIVRAVLPLSGSGPVNYQSCTVFSIAENLGNTGVEDVAFCEATNTVYAVKEMNPPTLYRIECNSDGDLMTLHTDDPFTINGKMGDAAGICALADGNLLILSQEDNTLYGYSGDGTLLSQMSVGMIQPEGIAFDTAKGIIYIVGEPKELGVFKPPVVNTERPASQTSLPGERLEVLPGSGTSLIFDFSMQTTANIRIDIAGLSGKSVAVIDPVTPAGSGRHRIVWNREGLPAGVYCCRVQSGPSLLVRRFVAR